MNYIFLSLLTSSGSDLLFSTVCQGSIHNLPRGWAMMILRGGGVTLFPYYDLAGAMENFQRKLHWAWGRGGGKGATIFFLKKKRKWKYAVGHSYNSSVFYFISTKCWYKTTVWNLMHDAHFLCYKVSLWVAQTHSWQHGQLLCSGLMKIISVL